ncbi:ferredoxin [Streptomyces sp. 769]|nr:ferredoxin [Streptomyces sp. 769]
MFQLHGEEGLLYVPAVPDDQLERVRQAVAACPVQAILMGKEVSAGAE